MAELNDTSLGDRKIMLEEARSKEDQALRKQDMVEKRNASRSAREAKAVETGGDTAAAAEKPKRKPRNVGKAYCVRHLLISAQADVTPPSARRGRGGRGR